MKKNISITAMASVSPLGSTPEEIWNNYRSDTHLLTSFSLNGKSTLAGRLSASLRGKIDELRQDRFYKKLDNSVLYALFAARDATRRAGWDTKESIGINIGSSRGATGLFEHYHSEFREKGYAETLASPGTTLGNISSWVAQDLQSSGPEISHSVTCSTGLHAVLNGVAWLGSGMAKKFIVGGSEAALTPFTMAQIAAMKIGARLDREYPCQALNLQKKKNTMVLGEGAALLCLEAGIREGALAVIKGVGYATERLKHPLSISANGEAFKKSMSMALGETKTEAIDVIVMHAPGTVKGDQSEMTAIKGLFQQNLPNLTTNKWKIGHTFGASGSLSLEMAILMLQHQEFISVPFVSRNRAGVGPIKNVLVNAVGFGGNAVSILVGLPD